MTESVVIVSNRLPISVKKVDGELEFFPSVGGLATGLASYVNDKRNKWIGWPGIPSDELTEAQRQEIAVELRKSNCYPVFLKQKQLDDYYNGYSNSILWPLFHDLPPSKEALIKHDRYWKAYKAVNSAFAGVVLALSEPRSIIWVHDYQLLLLPRMIRAVRPKDKIAFFLHIPFPNLKHFKQIESGRQLLTGMLGSSLVGMHTKVYAQNFLDACADLTREIVGVGQVIQSAYVTRVMDFPMGIDYERFAKARELNDVKKELRKHRRKYKGMKVILTVDRLDPTKGLVERLEAYHEFLRRNPGIHGGVIMAMLCVPSRTEIDEYKQLRERVEELVEQTNSQFGTLGWKPVDYMYTSMPVEAVTALYQVADIAFITPLRDGMNLVAKEYIASRPDRDGVLILSSTAGAAQELTDALLVNPRKRESLVAALTSAVKMPRTELRSRITTMHEHIATHTVQHWAGSIIKNLRRPILQNGVGIGRRPMTRSLTRERQTDLIDAYRAASHPVILLGYDGVLAQFTARPSDARPTRTVINSLRKFSKSKSATVAIISGRDKTDLDVWFGDLPISLVAEHGAVVKRAGRKAWKKLSSISPSWQHDVQTILEKYAANTPGAFVEVKDFALVWHYRKASPYYAQKHLVILRRILQPIAKSHGLGIYNGKKILEIKPADVNKGVAVQQFINSASDFILAIGDDYTDEDMFEQLPHFAYSVKVGRGATAARYRLKAVDDVQALLQKLAR